MQKWLDVVKVNVASSFLNRKDWVKYLVLVNWHAQQLGDVIQKTPDTAFSKFVEKQVDQYLKGKKPHASIESAIVNIADDHISGREVIIRAGDYIALQNHFRSALQ